MPPRTAIIVPTPAMIFTPLAAKAELARLVVEAEAALGLHHVRSEIDGSEITEGTALASQSGLRQP